MNLLDQVDVVFVDGLANSGTRYRLTDHIIHTSKRLVERIDKVLINIPGFPAVEWSGPEAEKLPVRLLLNKSFHIRGLRTSLEMKLPELMASIPRAPGAWDPALLNGLYEKIPAKDFDDPAPSTDVAHLRFMLEQIQKGVVVGEQAHRFFGFVQGVLATHRVVSVAEERERCRPFFKPKD